jgi:hypothetical protein
MKFDAFASDRERTGVWEFCRAGPVLGNRDAVSTSNYELRWAVTTGNAFGLDIISSLNGFSC